MDNKQETLRVSMVVPHRGETFRVLPNQETLRVLPETCTIGLDIGGTKIAGGIVAFPQGRILSRRVIPTRPERGGQAVLEEALALANRLMAEATDQGWAISGIGL